VPFAGFAAALLAAGWMSASSGAGAPAQIHARATAYAASVSEGRTLDAAAFHLVPDREAEALEAERARVLRGALWLVQGVDPQEDGRFVARVLWMRGESGAEEDQVWERGPDGRWRLWGWLDGSRRRQGLGGGAAKPRPAAFQ
jgi:hypothetical protein